MKETSRRRTCFISFRVLLKEKLIRNYRREIGGIWVRIRRGLSSISSRIDCLRKGATGLYYLADGQTYGGQKGKRERVRGLSLITHRSRNDDGSSLYPLKTGPSISPDRLLTSSFFFVVVVPRRRRRGPWLVTLERRL